MSETRSGPGGVEFACPGCGATVCIIGESEVLEPRDEPADGLRPPVDVAFKPHDCPAEVPVDPEPLHDALETWGLEAQELMTVEESAELILAFCRLWRGRADEGDVVDELADTRIMNRQMGISYGEQSVADRVDEKTERLRDRLDEARGRDE